MKIVKLKDAYIDKLVDELGITEYQYLVLEKNFGIRKTTVRSMHNPNWMVTTEFEVMNEDKFIIFCLEHPDAFFQSK